MKSAKLSMGLTILGVLLISSASVAQTSKTATANLQVSTSVAKNCTITATPVVFPAYEPIGANASSPDDSTAGGLTVTCTKGASTTIGLGIGSHANGTTMRMSDGGTNYLEYALYSNEARTAVWGNAAPNLVTPALAPSKDARTFSVYGRIAGNQDVPEGNYDDTVVATVNF